MTVTADELALIRATAISHSDVTDIELFTMPDVERTSAIAVVPESFASAVEIRNYLWEELGERLAPRVVALFDELPRDAAGAVSVVDLAARADSLPEGYVSVYQAPSTPVEAAVCEQFCLITGTTQVGVDDDFLDIGGDSSAAVLLSSRLHKQFGVPIPLEAVFQAATPRTIALLVELQTGSDAPPSPEPDGR
ncbi:phosphopantetheine-binding protein [Streptacidiphilus sp. P02-A3a]|uniref:phosphopantetheine-binding protein n=1 Tax=Streptacidiphilus sp. P02-A3a TaxID=2704468 RepID=UPI0015F7AF54|nr:phosphopantetheine-binding protein [Streptacidiphilus sp. P02-A3a]QMU67201.1 hypothetical protein GXP74_02230 [Streptacidiphilus sp. P02-A3a]